MFLYGKMKQGLLRSEIPSGMCAKLCTVAASNNRDNARNLPARATYTMVLFFTHIPFVVNHTINATPPERLQQDHCLVTIVLFESGKRSLLRESICILETMFTLLPATLSRSGQWMFENHSFKSSPFRFSNWIHFLVSLPDPKPGVTNVVPASTK